MIGRVRVPAALTQCSAAVLARAGDANYADGRPRNGYEHMDGYDHMMGPWGGGIFMWILGLLVIGVLIYFLVKGLRPGGFGQARQEIALETLKKRYARGEITKEQFDEMRKDL